MTTTSSASRPPIWALASASAAPVLLIGGWTLAARQQGDFNSVRDTISALAAHGAHDRWLMTSALTGLGICHLVTAVGLREARTPGRLLHGLGGVATVLVAVFPLPAQGGSGAHAAAAGTAFASLAVWPALAWRRDAAAALLRPKPAIAGAGVLLGLVTWFAAALGTGTVGVAERVAAGAQALWPLATVISGRRAPRQG